MFSVTNKNDTIRVGERNALASKKKLSELKIPLLAEDTGDTYGRTVVFYPKTGDYVIKAIGKPEKTI
jgi:chemotaxis protein CheD